jgi:integrase
MPKLTESFVQSRKPDGRDRLFTDSQLPGFGLRITATATKLFLVQARVAGRRRKVTLGLYPAMSVVQARGLALQALADLRRGADPKTERKRRAIGGLTVTELAAKWLAEHVRPKLKPRTVSDYEQLLAQRILPALGSLPVAAVSRDDVNRLHVAMRPIPRRANYTVSTVHALLNFAIDHGLRAPGTNPAHRIKFYRERKIERFLSESEMARAAEGISAAERAGKIGPHIAAGLRLALFTGARSGEIAAAQWPHVDYERRLIRLPDSKTNEPRTIHLSDAALEVLRAIPHIGPYIIVGAVPGEPCKNLSRAWIIARSYAGLDDVRLHDLRHSYASLAAGRGVSLQMIGKLLGHRSPQTTARYAHLARDAAAAVNDELGAAMTAAIEKGTPSPAEVIKLKPHRG